MIFKTPRIEAEYHDPAAIHPRIRQLVLFAEDWLYERGIVLAVTELLRTRAEQVALYAQSGNPDPPTSVHELGRGADIRTLDWPRNLIPGFVEMINNHFPYDPDRPLKQTCIFHDIGAGEHIHLQVAAVAVPPESRFQTPDSEVA